MPQSRPASKPARRDIPESPSNSPAVPNHGSAAADRLRQEKREHLRFDKAFPVRVESILFGEMHCVARNVSKGGIFLESADPLPLGAQLRICFLTPDESGEVVALGVVRNHYFINFAHQGDRRSVTGMAVRFVGFDEDSERHLRACLDRFRVLH